MDSLVENEKEIKPGITQQITKYSVLLLLDAAIFAYERA